MMKYNWSKEDFRELLIQKYTKMKEAIFIEGDSCVKCNMMKPHAQRRAENNGYEFQVFKFDDSNVNEFKVESVPMLVLREDWIVKDILDIEGIVHLISNK